VFCVELFCVVAVLLFCSVCDQKEDLVIQGSSPGLQDGMVVVLNNSENREKNVRIICDTVRDGQFELQGFTSSPVFSEIQISNKNLENML